MLDIYVGEGICESPGSGGVRLKMSGFQVRRSGEYVNGVTHVPPGRCMLHRKTASIRDVGVAEGHRPGLANALGHVRETTDRVSCIAFFAISSPIDGAEHAARTGPEDVTAQTVWRRPENASNMRITQAGHLVSGTLAH